MVCHAPHDVQELIFACALIISHCSFYHMPGAVEFVTVKQVLPPVFRLFNSKICIYIAILLLSASYQVYDIIHPPFQLLIPFVLQGICGSFQPFSQIAVLENSSIKFTFRFSSGYPEVFNSMALLYPRYLISQYLFLIGDHHI